MISAEEEKAAAEAKVKEEERLKEDAAEAKVKEEERLKEDEMRKQEQVEEKDSVQVADENSKDQCDDKIVKAKGIKTVESNKEGDNGNKVKEAKVDKTQKEAEPSTEPSKKNAAHVVVKEDSSTSTEVGPTQSVKKYKLIEFN